MSEQTEVIPIADPSQVGEARRRAARLSTRLALGEQVSAKLALVVTEVATNVQKHAGAGEILLRPIQAAGALGVEVIAIDQGPGIADVERALEDGYSTRDTPGFGLGAILRQASVFDLYSESGKGTAVLAQLWAQGKVPALAFEIGGVCCPHPSETVSGDAWACHVGAQQTSLLVVDGLGHGPDAARAARAVVEAFQGAPGRSPGEALPSLNEAARGTRGAAAALACIDPGARAVHYAGVGNISGAILSEGADQRLVSHPGTVGVEVRRAESFRYEWPPGALLVMHSDGVGTHWDLERYPGLIRRHPSLIASVLYRDFSRRRDDATVVVARQR